MTESTMIYITLRDLFSCLKDLFHCNLQYLFFFYLPTRSTHRLYNLVSFQ